MHRYNQKGGAYIKISDDAPNTYRVYIQEYVNNICGNFYMDDFDELVIDEDPIVTGQQNVCQIIIQIIYMAHPSSSVLLSKCRRRFKSNENQGRIVRSWIFILLWVLTIE